MIVNTEELRKIFEEKMKLPKTHPKTKLFMAAGPEFADSFYEAMFATFVSGYYEGVFEMTGLELK